MRLRRFLTLFSLLLLLLTVSCKKVKVDANIGRMKVDNIVEKNEQLFLYGSDSVVILRSGSSIVESGGIQIILPDEVVRDSDGMWHLPPRSVNYLVNIFAPWKLHVETIVIDPGHGGSDPGAVSCNKKLKEKDRNLDLALRLGKESMYEYFERYGLGSPLGVDYLGEAGGILMDKESAKTVDVARMGFGQAIAVTPLQLISAICSVINGGNLMRPYIVKSVSDFEGNLIYENSPNLIRKTVSQDTSEKIKVMFEAVVKQYSGINAFIEAVSEVKDAKLEGFRIGGKTGTSQKYVNGAIGDKHIASFVGAFPADNPEYAVLIIADEPSAGNYFGSIVATPYAKEIMVDMLTYKKYVPENLEEDLLLMEKNIEMPNLVGKSIADATNILSDLCLQFELAGDGLFIASQTPIPGTKLIKNAIVVLVTD